MKSIWDTTTALALAATVACAAGSIAATRSLAAATGEWQQAVRETSMRFERLAAVRSDPASTDRDERFDALLASLRAGVPPEAPAGLESALDRVAAARLLERTYGDRHPGGVSAALSEARDTIAGASLPDTATTGVVAGAARSLPYATLAAAIVASAAFALSRAASRRRRLKLAAMLDCRPQALAGAGLVTEILRHVDLECEAAASRALARTTARPRPAVAAAPAPPVRSVPVRAVAAPNADPASALRDHADGQSGLDTGDYELDTPIPGLESVRILEIAAMPLDDEPLDGRPAGNLDND